MNDGGVGGNFPAITRLETIATQAMLTTPFCEFYYATALNHHAHVRIRPIFRHIKRRILKKPVRNPLIRNAHICPCDSEGY